MKNTLFRSTHPPHLLHGVRCRSTDDESCSDIHSFPRTHRPIQHPFAEQPTVRSDASQPLTKRDKLTHAIYTSEKLSNAFKGGQKFFRLRFQRVVPKSCRHRCSGKFLDQY